MLASSYPKVSSVRLAEIAELAESIASENATQAGATDVEGLLRKKRITISYNDYGDDFCGLLEHKDGEFHIYCNTNQVKHARTGRARFTVCHELGHYFIDEHRQCLLAGVGLHGSDIDYHPRNPAEQEADCFASNLLMPEGVFRKIAIHPCGLKTILNLSDRLMASVTGTAVRYCELQVEPMAMVLWNEKGYAWKRLSQAFRAANCRKTIESVDLIDEGSATRQAMQGIEPGGEEFFSEVSAVSRWFPHTSPGSPADAILREEAIRLGDYGCLTVLTLERGETLSRW